METINHVGSNNDVTSKDLTVLNLKLTRYDNSVVKAGFAVLRVIDQIVRLDS